MRRTNAESSDTFTAKQGFFDRTLAPHTDRLGVSCRVQANALIDYLNRRIGEICNAHASHGSQTKSFLTQGDSRVHAAGS